MGARLQYLPEANSGPKLQAVERRIARTLNLLQAIAPGRTPEGILTTAKSIAWLRAAQLRHYRPTGRR